VCMCNDCQAFAHWLGHSEAILDAHGGTDIFQLTPAQLEITAGAEQIRCMRMSPKGLLRWYTACCRTPIANTMASPKLPFAGTSHCIMDHAGDGRARDEVLGPIRARVNGRFGVGELPEGSHARAPVGVIFRAMWLLLLGWFRRAHSPSPMFDSATGRPVVEPTVIALEERKALQAKCGPESAASS